VRWAEVGSFQRSGFSISFSSSSNFTFFPAKSKTLQKLPGQFFCLGQTIKQVLHGSSKYYGLYRTSRFLHLGLKSGSLLDSLLILNEPDNLISLQQRHRDRKAANPRASRQDRQTKWVAPIRVEWQTPFRHGRKNPTSLKSHR
jgi:hypothetical protein